MLPLWQIDFRIQTQQFLQSRLLPWRAWVNLELLR